MLLVVDAPELGAVTLDQLEVVVRAGEKQRTQTFFDQALRLPSTVGVSLPEADDAPAQEITLHLRATWDGGDVRPVPLSATLTRRQGGSLRMARTVSLRRPCLGPCPGPGQRQHAAMAYDERTGRVVLFGGSRGEGGPVLDDTWEWDGTAWMEISSPLRPPARAGHAMAFDPQRARPLLFGGGVPRITGAGTSWSPLGDTWEYLGAGIGWQRLAAAEGGPPARALASMAAAPVAREPGRRGVLLFGGLGADGGVLGDTWTWEGGRWIHRESKDGLCGEYAQVLERAPRCRAGAALATVADPDPALGGRPLTLLIGGQTGRTALGEASFDAQVWRWDGASWSRLSVETPPTALFRWQHQVVPTLRDGPAVLVAGGERDGVLLRDAFVLDLRWGFFTTQLGPAPLERAGAAAALSEQMGEVVLAGGRGPDGALGDTWTFRPTGGWTERATPR